MSETPVLPLAAKQTEYAAFTAEQPNYAGQAEQALASWEFGFDTAERFDLERDDAVDPALWHEQAAPVTTAPEYAAPRSRADEVAMSIERMEDRELHAQLIAHTEAIVHGLRKNYGLTA